MLAAMKIARRGTEFDDDIGHVSGGLPVALVNVVLATEGRVMFLVVHHDLDTFFFFSNILPTKGSESLQASPFETRRLTSLPVKGWSVADDGSVHIPYGSIMQKFYKNDKVTIGLPFLTDLAAMDVISTKAYINSSYKTWLALTKPEGDGFPSTIRVKFLPIGISTIENSEIIKSLQKEKSRNAYGIILATGDDKKSSTSAAT